MGEVGNAVAGYWNDTANGEWLLLPLPLELFGEPNLCSRWKAEGKKTSFMLHTRAVDLLATKCSRSFYVFTRVLERLIVEKCMNDYGAHRSHLQFLRFRVLETGTVQ